MAQLELDAMDSELREVYYAADIHDDQLIKTALDDAGIDARIVGEHLQIAVGDLPPTAITPRVWVRAEDYEQAREVVEDFESSASIPTPSTEATGG